MPKHSLWIRKSSSDLRAAKVLLKENILDAAIYHTQQCAEKALKGYLSCTNKKILKTHDLVVLVEYCIDQDKN